MASSMWWGVRKGEERSCQQKAVSRLFLCHKCADVPMNNPPISDKPKQGKAEERDGGHRPLNCLSPGSFYPRDIKVRGEDLEVSAAQGCILGCEVVRHVRRGLEEHHAGTTSALP